MMSSFPGENKTKSYFIFKLLPFANLDIQNFNKDISKTITARVFKLGQLIEDND